MSLMEQEKRGSEEKEKAGDTLGLRAVRSEDERNSGEENPTTYQTIELQLIIPECQQRHPAEYPYQ